MQTDTNMHTFAEKDDKIFIVIMWALPVDHLKWEQDELFPIVTDLKIHPAHPRRGLAVSWASVMRIRDGTRPLLPRLNAGITVVLIHSSQLTKQTAGVWRGFEAWKTSGQAQGEPSVQGCLEERKPHSTLHKPPEHQERHIEIKTQWAASFLQVRSNPGKGKAQQEWIKEPIRVQNSSLG